MKPWEKIFALRDEEAGGVDAALNRTGIAELEARTGLTLPTDFRDYLLRCASPEGWTDDEVTTWWEVTALRTVSEEYEHALCNPAITEPEHWLIFADYACWAMAWAIDCGPKQTGRVMVINGTDDRIVAETFGAFVDAYGADLTDLT